LGGEIDQKSSGTTGDPKVFNLDRKAMETSARKTLAFFGLEKGDRVLLCLPVDYIAGKMMVVRALVGGLDLALTEPSSRPLEKMEGDFRFVPMVPLQVLESLKAGDDLEPCGILLIGGGELPDSGRKQLMSFSHPAVYESFGMSESYTHFALRKINGPEGSEWFRVLEGVRISADSRSCLVLDMPGVTTGEVVSNDLVEIVADGSGFRWLGRYDNVINTGGIKVIPELLEQRISALLQTTCLLLPLPDEKLGQKMVLMVEWTVSAPPDAEWERLFREQLAPHEVPKQIIPVNEIPRNTSFKPDRQEALKMILT